MKKDVIQTPTQSGWNTRRTGALGVIMEYNKYDNTCTVALSEADSDVVTEIISNVACPTQIGVQAAAPEPGRICWVAFKSGNATQPFVVNYYNHRYQTHDYERQTRTPFSIPSHLMD